MKTTKGGDIDRFPIISHVLKKKKITLINSTFPRYHIEGDSIFSWIEKHSRNLLEVSLVKPGFV
jgi:hypothetical protein